MKWLALAVGLLVCPAGLACRHTAAGVKTDSKRVLQKTGKGISKAGKKIENAGK
jgi:hypothetical protein